MGRGVTFPGLQTIYYTRTSKKPQADTMWQHSRMFGYDRDPGMMMVYIDENLYKLFSDINATNNSIIAQVERGIDHVNYTILKDLIRHERMFWTMITFIFCRAELIIILHIQIMIRSMRLPSFLTYSLKMKNIIR